MKTAAVLGVLLAIAVVAIVVQACSSPDGADVHVPLKCEAASAAPAGPDGTVQVPLQCRVGD